MNTPNTATGRGSDSNGAPDWLSLVGKLALSRIPSAADWKEAVKVSLASGDGFSERMREASHQWSSGWQQRTDLAGLIEYWRQCSETAQQLTQRFFDSQMQAAAQWQQQAFALLPQWLNARGEGDMALVSNAAQQAARMQWDDQAGALLQWTSGVSPAFLQCLQQWLAASPETNGTPGTPGGTTPGNPE
jgi:hypothetical protein